MVETALARQDVHEPEVDVVDRHRVGDRPQTPEAADLAEAAACMAFLEQELERQAPGGAQVTTPLFGDPREVGGLLRHAHAAAPQQVGELVAGDGRPHVPAAFGETDGGGY